MFHRSVYHGRFEDAVDTTGSTALHEAVAQNHTECISMLLSHRSHLGDSALYLRDGTSSVLQMKRKNQIDEKGRKFIHHLSMSFCWQGLSLIESNFNDLNPRQEG
mmetsp:Transcript_11483/g.43105  ORF Transcript_11483/g.43105 Transcript_11483/m.43105 type:complete len:105 (+) Transcript_11483:1436-1750(+)